MVTSLGDSGAGTLREALAGADPTITFSVSGTINLTSGALTVNRAVSIDGTGQAVTVNNTVAGNRVFNVDDGTAANVAVTIQNLNVTGGNTAPAVANVGGGIRNTEALTLSNVTLSGNSAGAGGGIGVQGTGTLTGTNLTISNNVARYNGGGLAVSAGTATAEVSNSTITGNTVGAANASVNGSFGGGFFTSGQLTINNSTISGNAAAHSTGASSGFGAGGAANLQTGRLNLNGSTVSGNTASSDGLGGGLTAEGRSRITLSNSTVSQNVSDFAGGGIRVNTMAFLTMNDSTVSGNTSKYNGGGIVSYGTSTITGSQILNNVVGEGTSGMYLSVGGGLNADGTVTVTDSLIAGNTATVTGDLGFGGGVGILGGTNCTIVDSEIRDNVAERGGGFSIRDGLITIRGSHITGNSSLQNGGGIRIMRTDNVAANVTVEDTTIENNTADGGAGIGSSVYLNGVSGTVTLNVRRSTLSGNSSSFDGGGMEIVDAVSLLENSTIHGNSSYNDGAGIWFSSDAAYASTAAVSFSTITGNVAFNAGGIDVADGDTSIRNSIVAGNTASTAIGPDIRDTTTAAVIEFSLVESTANNNAAAGMGNITGVAADLGPLANNGGPTLTRLPNATSPVLGAADPTATLMEDQRGFTRPGSNASRDMGSVERDGVSPMLNLDFNNDGMYDCADMNLLENAIDAGMPIATFDVNGDSALTSADVSEWLIDAGALRFGAGRRFLPGDANLNGFVDGSDFGIWNANKFTPASFWCLGDFTQSGGTDGSDFGIWNANKFTASDDGRPSASWSGKGTPGGAHKGLREAAAARRHVDPVASNRSAPELVAPPAARHAAAVDAAFRGRLEWKVQPAEQQQSTALAAARRVHFGTARYATPEILQDREETPPSDVGQVF